MRRARLNFKEFQEYIARDKGVKAKMLDIIKPKVEESKQILIAEFSSHPVSTEIASGPNSSNSSGTLGGYGNLFSFIGFSSGDNPVDRWVNFIKKAIMLQDRIDVSISGGDEIVFKFKINSISNEDLLSAGRMPWEGGRSWIEAVERGISGFSFYISKASTGRSGGGIQSKNKKKSGGSFRNVPYWSRMWNNFNKNISQ
jgi:hypothetical protein